jgi:hypothetical protein
MVFSLSVVDVGNDYYLNLTASIHHVNQDYSKLKKSSINGLGKHRR